MSFLALNSTKDAMMTMSVLLGLSVFFLVVMFWPRKKWTIRSGHEEVRISSTDSVKDRKVGPIILQAVLLIVVVAFFAFVLNLVMGLPIGFSVILALGLTMLVIPMVKDARLKKKDKQARKEALSLSQYVVGRLSAQASLLNALKGAGERYRSGALDLDLCGDDLLEAVRAVEMQQDMEESLAALASRFKEYPELSGLFKTYAMAAGSDLGQESRTRQAEDVADQITRMDTIKNDLDVELTTSRGTRLVMLLLMIGMTLYLIAGGGDVGDALINTLPGNAAIGFCLMMLSISQLVSARIEKMPEMRF